MKKLILLLLTAISSYTSSAQLDERNYMVTDAGILVAIFDSDPVAIREGQKYWNRTNKTYRVYDGVNWVNSQGNYVPMDGTPTGQKMQGIFDIENATLLLGDSYLVPEVSGAGYTLGRPGNGKSSINITESSGIRITYSASDSNQPNAGTSRGIASNFDFTPNITDLDFVQKKYVDVAIASISSGSSTALTTTYDNTDSSNTGTNVKDVLDDLRDDLVTATTINGSPIGNIANGDINAVTGGKIYDFTDELHTRDEKVVSMQNNTALVNKAEHTRLKPVAIGTNFFYRDNPVTWTTTGVTIEANGTITIAPNGTIKFPLTGNNLQTTWFYYWFVETNPIKGETALTPSYTFHNTQTHPSQHTETKSPQNGVYSFGMVNAPNYTWVNLEVTNTTAHDVTIYPVVITNTLTDDVPAYKTYDSSTPVVDTRTIKNFDWYNDMGGDLPMRLMAEKGITKSADAINGSNANDGLSLFTPKLDAGQIPAIDNLDLVGFGRESLFRERPPLSTGKQAIAYTDISINKMGGRLPRLTGQKIVDAIDWVDNSNGTYSYTWTAPGVMSDNGYNEVYVTEINTTTEDAQPISSERRMKKVADVATVISTVGSETLVNNGSNSWTATIHPTDGNVPNTLYRYEVTNLYKLIDDRNELGGRLFQGIEYTPSSEGYGLALPRNSVIDRSIFKHGPIHQVVQKSGHVQRSLFYGVNNPNAIPLTFYQVDGLNDNWSVDKSFFYNTGNIYTHISSGQNYNEGSVTNVIAVTDRDENNSLFGHFGNGSNINSILYEDNYVTGYSGFGQGVGSLTMRGNLVNKTSKVFLSELTENNIFFLENHNGTSINDRGIHIKTDNQNAKAVFKNNMVFYKYVPFTPVLSADTKATILGGSPTATFEKNIFIIDTPLANPNIVGYAASEGVEWTSDYNIYIVIDALSEFEFAVVGTGTLKTWETYRETTGQDTNSLYIDLKQDPRGYEAVFVDAENGDYRWASTDVAKKISDYCAKHNIGTDWIINKMPAIPTVDEAATIIQKL